MTRRGVAAALSAAVALGAAAFAAEPVPAPQPTAAEILAATTSADWRPLDPENTLYLELGSGRIVFELAPEFAPQHVANVKALARERYFDGLGIVRSQENYVVQWGDPDADDAAKRRPIRGAKSSLPAELFRPIDPARPFTPLPDGDVYAPEVGFAGGFPAARDPRSGTTWLAHCYGMLGAGRGDGAGSGSGAELYVVIGHAPRHLDKNVTLLGRAVAGTEQLSTLPRGRGPLGFYEKREQVVPLVSLRVAADLPPAERSELELLRTDTPTFAAFVAARRTRREAWFLDRVGKIELCNVPLPVRPRAVSPPNP
jgi:peptidylprolyl isomerase